MKGILLALVLASVSLSAQNQTQAQIDKILTKAKADIDALYAPPAAIVVTGPLQAALDKAAAGASLVLPIGYTDNQPVTITKPVTITGRVNGTSYPTLRGGLTTTGNNISITGVEVWKLQQNNDVVMLSGDAITLTDVRVFGMASGQKRGILGNASHLTLRKVRVEGIWLPDQDAQAFACWDGCSDVLVEDSYFSGAGETFLIGGADPSSVARMPRNITVRRSTLTKDLAWKKPGVQVKTTLEAKCVDGLVVEDSIIERSWQSAQDGYLILLTPRNQDGHAPFCGVRNVIIRNNSGGDAAGFLLVSGTDTDRHVSDTLQDVQVVNNRMTGFDPTVWRSGATWGTNKLIQIIKGPANLTISGNVLSGAPYTDRIDGSALYFDEGTPKLVNFTFTNNTYPPSTYGIFGGDSAPGAVAWAQYVASGTLSGNVER